MMTVSPAAYAATAVDIEQGVVLLMDCDQVAVPDGET